MKELVFAIWFFLPVGFANMAPVFAAHSPILGKWNYPLDCYKKYRGKRILGDNKTIRGLISGILLAILTVFLEQYFYNHWVVISQLSSINYNSINPFLFGILCAVGALGGDAFKSFIKRQKSITPGKAWVPFDQIDFIIGAIITTALYIPLSVPQYILILITWFVLHILATHVGYFIKLKKTPL